MVPEGRDTVYLQQSHFECCKHLYVQLKHSSSGDRLQYHDVDVEHSNKIEMTWSYLVHSYVHWDGDCGIIFLHKYWDSESEINLFFLHYMF